MNERLARLHCGCRKPTDHESVLMPRPEPLLRFSQANIRAGINLTANYANVALMALITLLIMPVYVHTLGPAQWGVVALCTTLHGAMFAIDVALGPLMLRDIARAAIRQQAYSSYLRFLRVYACFAVAAIALVQVILALNKHWPHGAVLPMDESLLIALQIILLQFLFQFSNSAALGYWNGLERQRQANVRLAIFLLLKHALALWAVLRWDSTAIAYLGAFAAVSAVECLVNFSHIYRARGGDSTLSNLAANAAGEDPDRTERNNGVRQFGLYGVAAALGVATTQIDRVYLSLTLSTEQFGVYFLVGTLMLSMLSLQVPIQRAFLPQIATADWPRAPLVSMFKASFFLIAIPSVAIAAFPQAVLRLWLGSSDLTSNAPELLRLSMLAVALLAVSAPAGLLLLRQARYGLMMGISGGVLLVQLLLLIALTPSWGILAGGLAWLSCGLIQACVAAFLWRINRLSQVHPAMLP